MLGRTDPIFAPVGIAHLTSDNVDLLRAAAAGRRCLRFTTAAQLNGNPHIGTVVTILTVFALARHAADRLNLPATVIFDALENAPGERVERNGETYTRTVGDLIESGHSSHTERFDGFAKILTWVSQAAGIRYEVRPYATYQALRPVRECLHHIATRLDDFRPIVAPADGIVRIRPRCPRCHLVEKSATSLRISTGPGVVHLDSRCPDHGPYRASIHVNDTDGWYDANTPVRSIQKCYLLAAERDRYDACSASVDGADWGGAWHAHVLAPALAALGVPVPDWPISIFTPLIIDRTGGKLSKTLYVRHGAYAELPDLFLDLNILVRRHGTDILATLWAEVCRWAAEPRRLHRHYSVDYLSEIIHGTQPGQPARLRSV